MGNKKSGARETVKIMRKLRELLKSRGVGTRVVSVAKTGSCYIDLLEEGLGKIRIGDHNERLRYGYRWQIRMDLKVSSQVKDSKGHKQYFYSPDSIEAMVRHIINYRNVVRRSRGKGGSI